MKKLFSIIVLLAFVFGSSLVMAQSENIGYFPTIKNPTTKIGVDWSYGRDFFLPDDWTSEECENTRLEK